jgi:hypothetical protein
VAYTLISLVGLTIGSYLPLGLAIGTGAMIGMAILLAWGKAARDLLPFTTLFMIPLYLLWKIPVYFKFFRKPQASWNKTQRDATIGKRD